MNLTPACHGETRRAVAIQRFGAKAVDRFATFAMAGRPCRTGGCALGSDVLTAGLVDPDAEDGAVFLTQVDETESGPMVAW